MKNQDTNLKYIKAKSRVEREKGFYTHLIIYLSVNVVITGLKVWDNLGSWDSFVNELQTINVWSTWVIWGIVLLMHFFSLRFGQGWEERKLEEFMQQELKKDSEEKYY